jgi:hypothetical protein
VSFVVFLLPLDPPLLLQAVAAVVIATPAATTTDTFFQCMKSSPSPDCESATTRARGTMAYVTASGEEACGSVTRSLPIRLDP